MTKIINQSINHLIAHNTLSNETVRAADSQAPGVLMAALIKHTKNSCKTSTNV